MLDVVRYWLNLGLDGFRLDAVPYLFERDGMPPKVGACNGTYRFGQAAEGPPCAAIAAWS